MFIDGRTFDDDAVLSTDLCIVGAGAAGITLAKSFVGSSVRVLLLESGGFDFDPATQSLYEGRNVGVGYYPLDVCRLRYFGGSTNAWGGWCRPLDAIDFAPRSWVPDSGWPFGRETLDRHYAEASELCQIANPRYDPASYLGDARDRYLSELPMDGTGFETTIFTFSPPTRFGRRYADALRRAPNITCVTQANVTDIDTAEDGRATSVAVRRLSGGGFTVRAKAFVLAAGGIENARLLLLSNRRQPAGLGNGHDLVGRYFMEHTHTERRLVPARRDVPLDLYGVDFVRARISGRLSLTPQKQRADELLQYGANIEPVYAGEDSAGWRQFVKLYERLAYRYDPMSRLPPYERKRVRAGQIADILAQPFDVARAAVANAFRARGLVSHYVVKSKGEQGPNPASRVRLSADRDRLGQNRIELHWALSDLDRRTVCAAEDILDGALRRLGIGAIDPRPACEQDAWPDSLVGGWHQLGTTRMHPDPKKGVVDADGRVHGAPNLFVAGGSVFPTCGAATPTLTIVALALRLGQHLRSKVLAFDQIAATAPPAPIRAARRPTARAAKAQDSAGLA